MKHWLYLLTLTFSTVVHLAGEDATKVHAWYRAEGIRAMGAEVISWENAAASDPAQSLTRIVGQPQAWLVNTPGGERTILRLDGKSALWQTADLWGTLAEGRTIVALVRITGRNEGVLFDGSTRSGMTRVQNRAGSWQAGIQPPLIADADAVDIATHPVQAGRWQLHSLVFKKTAAGTDIIHRSDGVAKAVSTKAAGPLSGFILGANVATQRGLACDVAELLVYDHALSETALAGVEKDLATRWGTPTDLPEARQPKPPSLPNDPRIFRTTIRQRGDDGVHTYRIPGLATTPRGTLIAVFDARNQGSGDLPGDIDVAAMRSTDDGATWGAMQRIMDYDAALPGSLGNGVGDPAVLVDAKTGVIFVAALWSKGPRAWAGSGPGMTPEETGQLVLVKSTDDGVTWSKPVNLTPQIKRPEWRLLFNGPGSGIQLRDGTLVFAAQFKDAANVPHSCFIASADGGETWKISPPAIPEKPPTSEAQIAECSDGSLLLTMRNEARSGQRAWARWQAHSTGYSHPPDRVQSNPSLDPTGYSHPSNRVQWSEAWFAVTDPTCMASLIRHPEGPLLFANPNHASRRIRLSIRHSSDDGKTWSEGQLLDPGLAMYSCLSILRDGRIGILYESGETTSLVFARFPLEWALGK